MLRLPLFHVATFFLATLAEPNLISVPDLHGDYDRAVQVLTAAGLIDAGLAWTGGSKTLVQTGDIVDRGPDSLKIYKLFDRLSQEAPKQGGQVVNLLGNHELMNIQGDLRYVNAKELQGAGGHAGWKALWEANAPLGQQIRKFKTAAKVGSVLFVHAGLLPTFIKNGRTIDDVNRDMRTALAGEHNLRSLAALTGDEGPLWTRFYAGSAYGGGEMPEICKTVAQVLKQVGAARMVIGHTIQQRDNGDYRISPVCDGSLVLGDTGISSAYGGEMSYIEYDAEGNAAVHYPARGLQEPLPKSPLFAQLAKEPVVAKAPPAPVTLAGLRTKLPAHLPSAALVASPHSGPLIKMKIDSAQGMIYVGGAFFLLIAIFYSLRTYYYKKKSRCT